MGFLFYITLAKVMICGSLVFIKKNFFDLIFLANLLSVWSVWVVVHIFVYKEGKVISEPSGSSHIIINL